VREGGREGARRYKLGARQVAELGKYGLWGGTRRGGTRAGEIERLMRRTNYLANKISLKTRDGI
jgi:hypothetical protein